MEMMMGLQLQYVQSLVKTIAEFERRNDNFFRFCRPFYRQAVYSRA